jgi:histidine triad (HIT) family protein
MASVFTLIIEGKLPGRFVWKDEHCVGFLTIHPLRPGHTLVVPRMEVDHWLDLEPALTTHLTLVAQSIGRAIDRVFHPSKVGLMIAGLEVPHVHLHVIPIRELTDLNPANQDLNPDPADLDRAAHDLRAALRELGHSEVAD